MKYFAMGGNADCVAFEAYLYGLVDPVRNDAVILSWVVDEVLGRYLLLAGSDDVGGAGDDVVHRCRAFHGQVVSRRVDAPCP